MHIKITKIILLLHIKVIKLKMKGIIMINVFNLFNKVYEDLSNKNFNVDEDLIKYFKSEYGMEWKIELDKYLLKTEFDIKDKAA